MSIAVLRYLEYALTKDNSERAQKNTNILNGIHPDLKYEILEEIYVRIFKNIKGLSDMPFLVLGRLAQNAEECDFAPGEIIIDVPAAHTGNRLQRGPQSLLHREWQCHRLPQRKRHLPQEARGFRNLRRVRVLHRLQPVLQCQG